MENLKTGKYQHYKGKYYEVIGCARHSETLEEMVVYRPLYKTSHEDKSLWVRPRQMFTEEVIIEGETKPRFQFIDK